MLYRAFFLDEDDRIFAFHLMECLDDGDAIAQAQDLPAKCSTVEVWEGARVVGRAIRPRRTEVTADPYQISASINTGEVSDEPPRVLVSLAMLELQANHRERAACLVDEVYAAFDQADSIIKTSAIERTDASIRPAGHSSVPPRSPLHHAASYGGRR
jgi:hypothetical protein